MADLQRFVDAQAPVYRTALDELGRGRKETHWMWFIFPQLAGLGRSAMAEHYAIGSIEEARTYLAHPLLGSRLDECARAVNVHAAYRDLDQILGDVDARKFWSSMTLFDRAGAVGACRTALDTWFSSNGDPGTLQLLNPD